MAKCDQGYLCEVCGEDVAAITDSDLYLRYVIGMVDPETLHTSPERHIRCNPSLAQFIVADEFPAVTCSGAFDKKRLDDEFVRQREQLVTRGWRRLHEVVASENAIIDYPLPEVKQKLRKKFGAQ
ncbi:MAG: hypothetical protein GTO53_09315 [Planctomycetales bacterium]|nr:hypothetical protein [Planctomycetales bacterium]NIM09324.1 hypothetical protein [Planctomycetales bacterium]NIN08792.1 hypothetical protein [Planctomycetales bacterium]NIN77909.1 hypothetical protein [Planctomycetales bacterium]NIO35092.1 hypothetical protein [Planctomycetales bacterium]